MFVSSFHFTLVTQCNTPVYFITITRPTKDSNQCYLIPFETAHYVPLFLTTHCLQYRESLVSYLILFEMVGIFAYVSYRHLREIRSTVPHTFPVYFYFTRNCVPGFVVNPRLEERDQDEMWGGNVTVSFTGSISCSTTNILFFKKLKDVHTAFLYTLRSRSWLFYRN